MRPHRRALSRQGDGDRAGQGALSLAATPVHGGAARSVAAPGPGYAPCATAVARRYSEPGESPFGLCVSHALPIRTGRLRRNRAAAAGDRAGTLQSMPARRRAMSDWSASMLNLESITNESVDGLTK